jgi:hypothetical protein
VFQLNKYPHIKKSLIVFNVVMNKGLNDFLDKVEGREVGSSTKGIKKKCPEKEKVAKKMDMSKREYGKQAEHQKHGKHESFGIGNKVIIKK